METAVHAPGTRRAIRPRRAWIYAAAGAVAALLIVTTLVALQWAEPSSVPEATTPSAVPAPGPVVEPVAARPPTAPSPLAAPALAPLHVPVSDEAPQSE